MSEKIQEVPSPVVDYVHKRDLPGIVRMEEINHAWEGWGEKRFISELRAKNVVGMVAKVVDTVVGFIVYRLEKTEIQVLKFECSPEFEKSRVKQVLLMQLKEKGVKYKLNVVAVFPEARESIPKYKFFAEQGLSSRLKKNYFSKNGEIASRKDILEENTVDGYEFTWKSLENEGFGTDSEALEAKK